MTTILFPGRHHILTKFQEEYLIDLVINGIEGKKVERIIFAVTSSNHENTRRNPLPLYLRTIAITELAKKLACEVKIYPIPDISMTNKFAKIVLRQINYQSGEKLSPENTILACSTPGVIELFKKEKFENLPVELVDAEKGVYSQLRPFEVINLLVKSGKSWRTDKAWQAAASAASVNLYLKYNLGDLFLDLFNDHLLNDDANITETREYSSYGAEMDKNVRFKYDDIRPFIQEGKIVDSGCGTGSLIQILAKEFPESDVIGIEGTRRFYEYCRAQDYGDTFVYFYRKNILDQIFKSNTINTFIYSSVLHEVYSYMGEKALHQLLKNTRTQLKLQGRIIIRDVVGPARPKKLVLMKLSESDGEKEGDITILSTYAKFFRFTQDFLPRPIIYKVVVIEGQNYIQTTLQNAYEYLSKMTYVTNWASEMHEEFGFYSFSKWQKLLKKMGYKILENSKSFQSDYIIKNMYSPRAILLEQVDSGLIPLPYPPTNMILAAEKI